MIEAFRELDLVPGALETFQQLKAAGWRLVALTNDSANVTRTLLERAGAMAHFDEIASCDAIRTAKPHPDTYRMFAAEGVVWLVAANAWDVVGALRAELRAAFVSAMEGGYPAAYPQPQITAPTLPQAATQIINSPDADTATECVS